MVFLCVDINHLILGHLLESKFHTTISTTPTKNAQLSGLGWVETHFAAQNQFAEDWAVEGEMTENPE